MALGLQFDPQNVGMVQKMLTDPATLDKLAMRGDPTPLQGFIQAPAGQGLQVPQGAPGMLGQPAAAPVQQGIQVQPGMAEILGQQTPAAPAAPGMNWMAALQGLQMAGGAQQGPQVAPPAAAPMPQASFQRPQQTFTQSIYGG